MDDYFLTDRGDFDDDNDIALALPEDRECTACDGTGEGQYDGASCPCCKGKGYN